MSRRIQLQCAPLDIKFKTTPVEGDGSCFFYSLYTCLSAVEFNAMTDEERRNFVRKERLRLASGLSFSEFLSLAAGSVVSSLIQKKVRNDLKRALKKYKINLTVTDLMSKHIINPQSDALSKKMVDSLILYEDYPRFNCKIKKIINNRQVNAFGSYKDNLANPAFYIDNYYIQYIMNRYNINILFFNSDGTHYPTTNFKTMLETGFPFILIHYISEGHFEPIAEKRGNYLVRYFLPSHPVIQSFKANFKL